MSQWMKVCKCGDYKEQHREGKFECVFDVHGIPEKALRTCPKYRFSHHEEKLTYEEFKEEKNKPGFMLTRKFK